MLNTATFRTFIVDPPTMLLFGIGAVLFFANFFKKNPQRFILIACVLFQVAFWIMGPMMYLDHPFFASKGLGNEFMWNGYLMGYKAVPVDWIPTYKSPAMNFLAVVGWLVQPIFLYWGVRLGWRLTKKVNREP